MFTYRRADERGTADHGWLYSKHTFSFAGYYDPNHMGFRSLRVINEDRVAPGQGFGTHPHRDMEIISYVLDGALEHKDSMGNGSVIRSGDLQRMSAGTGVTHSEFNHSITEPVHFLQIWIEPRQRGLRPSYEQRNFSAEERQGRWRLVASEDGQDDSVVVRQDVKLYATLLEQGDHLEFDPSPGRHIWLQLVKGTASINDQALNTGDAAYGAAQSVVHVQGGSSQTELLLFDLA